MASVPLLNKVGTEGGRSSGSSEAGSETPTADPNPIKLHNGSSNHSTKINSTRITKSDSGHGERFEYSGWVYHLGVNTIGHEYCHFRFLFIRGKYVEMYKRDPSGDPGIKPIRRGVIGHTLMLEELGRRKLDHGDVYVLRFYNRLDESKKGEIACATAGDARTWMEAFDQAKQQVEYELSRGASVRNKLNMDDEINLEGHRHKVRRYAHSLKKLVKIGQGPEMLLRKASNIGANGKYDVYFDADAGDAVEAHEWKCVRTINGARIFEDVAKSPALPNGLRQVSDFRYIIRRFSIFFRLGKFPQFWISIPNLRNIQPLIHQETVSGLSPVNALVPDLNRYYMPYSSS